MAEKRRGLVQSCFNDDSILDDNEILHNKKTDESERKPNSHQASVIKKIIGKCEIQSCKIKRADILHHINGDNTDPSYGNLIVLCTDHHTLAEGKGGPSTQPPQKGRPVDLSKARLRYLVKNGRNPDQIKKIKEKLAKIKQD